MRDPNFNDATKWANNGIDGWSVSGGKANASASVNTTLYDNGVLATPTGKLYKIVTVCDSLAGGSFAARLAGTASGASRTSAGAYTDYLTGNGSSSGVGIIPTSLTAIFDSQNAYQVLTPDTTGVSATSLTNGGINPNSASYVVTVTRP